MAATYKSATSDERIASRPRQRLRNPRHDVLFESVSIGPKLLRNRFYAVPHCTGFGTEKPLSQAAFRATKAEGGWAAVCTEYAPVSADSDTSPHVSSRLWDDDDARNLGAMCDAVHAHGALAGVELHHGGSMARPRESRWPTIAPSPIANDVYPSGSTPKEMDLADIARVKRDWVTAAKRACDVGFDIVYVYGAHSFLFSQFLSPVLNRRGDAYGGTFENRARLWLETLDAVRAAVGDHCAIAVRFAIDSLGPWGVARDEGLRFVTLADPLVDLWDVSIGAVAGEGRVDSGASRFFKEGYQLAWTTGLRQVTDKPVVGVGRFTNPDMMADVVRTGELDLIGAARPSIADPFLPAKIEAGQYGEIRECIGCNFCYSRAEYGNHLGCTQNATAGEEYRRGWHPESFPAAERPDRDVLVLGAGPAGIECALVLAKRGFRRVHLVEADREIGGTARWVPQLPGLGEWNRVLGWRRGQLDRLKDTVEVILGTRLAAQDVLEYGAELVVLATGSYWATDGLSSSSGGRLRGADASQPHVLTPEQIMLEGKRPPGERVLVYDCDGYFMAAGLAEMLAGEGYRAALVTPHELVAPLCFETLEYYFLRRRLHDAGITMITETIISSIEQNLVTGEDAFGDHVSFETDAVVLVTQRVARDELYRELSSLAHSQLRDHGIDGIVRAGDCVAPRMLGDAIFDGHRVAREIESACPDEPLPYRRERLVVE